MLHAHRQAEESLGHTADRARVPVAAMTEASKHSWAEDPPPESGGRGVAVLSPGPSSAPTGSLPSELTRG